MIPQIEFDFSKLAPRDVLDLAIYVEEEAEGHYEQMTGWMDASGVTAMVHKGLQTEHGQAAEIQGTAATYHEK